VSWRIFEKWFNSEPWKDAEYITDNRDEKFWINWGTHFGLGPKLWVYYRGNWVATVESAWNDDGGLDLADIIIFEDHQDLRQRGLGKKMMKLFIEKAKEEGATFIWGFISAHEGSTVEYLIDWYDRQGFQVYEAKPGNYQILLKLASDNK